MVCNMLLITLLLMLTFSQILAEDAITGSQLSQRQLDSDLTRANAIEAENNNLDQQLWNEKRASSFMAMRGRKSSFMPLRGKKEMDMYDEVKRAQSFMPMRGRREFGDYYENYYPAIYNPELKRSSFVPLRGKKDDSTTDKRASFHALRGKKDVNYDLINDVMKNNMYDVVPQNAWNGEQSKDEKRARSAFYGLRGKRSINL